MSTSSMTTSRHLQAHHPDDKDPSLLADIKPGQYLLFCAQLSSYLAEQPLESSWRLRHHPSTILCSQA